MIKRLLRATLTFCAACLCAIGTAFAAPEEYGLILTRHETIEIDGNKIAVPIDVWMKTRFADGSAYFDLWADADLSELQEKASDIAGRMGRYRSCGDRVRVSSAVLEPGEEKGPVLHARALREVAMHESRAAWPDRLQAELQERHRRQDQAGQPERPYLCRHVAGRGGETARKSGLKARSRRMR